MTPKQLELRKKKLVAALENPRMSYMTSEDRRKKKCLT